MGKDITEVQSVEAKTKPAQNWVEIGLFSVLGLVLAGGLVFAGYKLGQRQTPPKISQPTLVPTKTAVPTLDPTADWETYTSKKYGFLIKYPPVWRTENFVDRTGHETVYFKYGSYRINVGFFKNEEVQRPFKEWTESYLRLYDKWQFGEMTPKTIDNHNALEIETLPSSHLQGTFVFIETRSGIASFFTTSTSREDGAFRVFNLMLSTFEFLPPKSLRTTPAPTPFPTTFSLPDVSSLKPNNLSLKEYLFVDLENDGQKELILHGTDKDNVRLGQVGQAEMPLVLVYKYNLETSSWKLRAKIDATDFPNTVNYITVEKLETLKLGDLAQAVIGVYSESSSRVNHAFFAITSTLGDIKKFIFPIDEYKVRAGARWPHTVEILANGKIQTREGIYKPQDANCCPSGGSVITTYKIDPARGIIIQDVVKSPKNLAF